MKENINDFIDEVFALSQTDEIKKSADEAIERFKSNKLSLELKECEIFKAINASCIAERFFKKSRYWISHKINHTIKNGKPDEFTPEQKQTLKKAMKTIAYELQELADNM